MSEYTGEMPLTAQEEAYVRAQTETIREFERRSGRDAPAAEHLVSRLLATLDKERSAVNQAHQSPSESRSDDPEGPDRA